MKNLRQRQKQEKNAAIKKVEELQKSIQELVGYQDAEEDTD